GPVTRLSSGLRNASEVMPLVTEPSPVLAAFTGNAYGMLGMILPNRVGVPEPVVTEMVFLSFQSPSVSATALFCPNSSNGNEFTTVTSRVVLVRAGFGPPGGKPISVKKNVCVAESYRQRTSPSANGSWNKVARVMSGISGVPFTVVSRAALLTGSQTALGLPG